MQKGFIEELKTEHNQRNQDKVTLSIRLSIKEDLVLQELADSLDTTRQDIINRLIDKYIVQEWENLRENDKQSTAIETASTSEPRYFLLNTNSANDIDDHHFMLDNQVAAAFEDGYKEKINRIRKGDYVFLYASGQGIVAYGRASGKVEKKHHYGVEDKTYFQKLDHYQNIIESPIKAKQIKSILGRSFPFAQTLAEIFDGEKLLVHLNKE